MLTNDSSINRPLNKALHRIDSHLHLISLFNPTLISAYKRSAIIQSSVSSMQHDTMGFFNGIPLIYILLINNTKAYLILSRFYH